jgi:hypothetical protein
MSGLMLAAGEIARTYPTAEFRKFLLSANDLAKIRVFHLPIHRP